MIEAPSEKALVEERMEEEGIWRRLLCLLFSL